MGSPRHLHHVHNLGGTTVEEEELATLLAGPPPTGTTAPVSARRWLILAVLCLSLLVTGIDGTIVNVALPTLVRDLHTSASQLQWVVDGYTIVFASFLLIAGNTGDRLGRKGAFIGGLLVFGAGSLACALVHQPQTLIFMRGVEGLGAAFIMPATLSILTNVFTDDVERAKAISIWAGVSGLGVAIGPLAGGFLLQHFWWGSIFLVNVPIVAVAIVAAVALVPDSRDPEAPRLDLIGTVLSTTGLIGVLYGIIQGPSTGWGKPGIIGAFVGGAVLLTAFVLWERHTSHPLLDVGLFANPRFTAASLAVTLVFFAMFGSLYFISQYLQFVLGYSPFRSGLALLPVAGVLMIAAPASAKLVARVGTKAVVTGGLLLVVASLLIFSTITATSGYGLIALVLVVIGVGMGLAMAPATDSIMGSVPPEKAGVGSATNDTTREIGGALGVAIMGSITTAIYVADFATGPTYRQLHAKAPVAAEAARASIGGAAIVSEKLPAAAAHAVTALANNAFVHALSSSVIVAAVVAFAGAVVALVFLPARAGARDDMATLIDGAAQRLDGTQRRSLAAATLGLLADAGMSSLTYNGVSARSGVATTTLQRYWTSRVDAVTDALQEIFAAHPVPDTGDLRADLEAYLEGLTELLSWPRSRQVIGALVTEAASDPELMHAFRARVTGPRRRELAARLESVPHRVVGPVAAAVDKLVGPLYYRSLIDGLALDRPFIRSVVESVIGPERPAVTGEPQVPGAP